MSSVSKFGAYVLGVSIEALSELCLGRRGLWFTLMTYFKMRVIDPVGAKSFLVETRRSIRAVRRYRKRKPRLVERRGDKRLLFLLGSGPSINEISNEQWAEIRSGCSWAFNFFMVHPHVPDRFYFQTPYKRPDLDQLMASLLESRLADYRHVEAFARGDAVNRAMFERMSVGSLLMSGGRPVFFMEEAFVPSYSKVIPSELVGWLRDYGFFEENTDLPVPKFGSTICLMVAHAIRQGHTTLVLCGIDMNDRGHFYDAEPYIESFPGLSLIRSSVGVGAHPHGASVERPYGVKDYLLALRALARELGGDIYVSSKTSALYPEFECYSFAQ